MFAPLLVLGLVALFGLAASRGSHPQSRDPLWRPTPQAVSGGTTTPHLLAVAQLTRNGHNPPQWLVNEAIREAFESGRFDLVRALDERYGDLQARDSAAELSESAGPQAEAVTVSGKSSPLDGVSNADWEAFVGKLSTEPPDFSSKRHLGAYHHSRDRIKQLGLPEPTNESEQYDALAADLVDAHDRAADLVRSQLATEVSVDGNSHPVTLSGILGVLKAAGVEGATSWFADPADRAKFPHTTATFLATNGMF